MTAKQLFEAGRLTDAVAMAGEEIKANPSDQHARVFLFELLSFSGDLVRAGKQLDAVTANEVEAEIVVARYRNLLSAEAVRRKVFAGEIGPHIPEPVPAYAGAHVQAAKELHHGSAEEALNLLERAQELRSPLAGRLNGEVFEDFRDCDDLIAPFLEAVIEGQYCWIPWESIRSLSVEQPKYLRDLCWAPAKLELQGPPVGETYLPVLYPDSHLHSDDLVRLGRVTDWKTGYAGLALGVGQRLVAAGESDRAILDIRQLEFDHANAGYSFG